ncbi:DUF934 domain-containing protein [Xanthobacter dioxanivorans]|uniref:DUF934 domain-containing protein n=1 Tax=Xanthobacter dioxanivorans TaxID=2528964 RepID=A0A974PJI4_9HYPH|nr:DUF934 domain-containing protein [Xanthobacter dioxanivorans]QRG04740.1 DUF934 domain-containing protein [Xanthobacter dioxanivorans]
MPLVKNGAPAADAFVSIADGEALPDGPVIVSAERLLSEGPALSARNGDLGVAWPNNRDVAELQPFLSRLSLIALTFPKFRDGRAYSQARLLRERFGFKGELRAVGNVLRDQVLFMVRAGFDAFSLEKEADAAAFGKAVATYSVFYQPTGDGRATVRDARRAELAAQG